MSKTKQLPVPYIIDGGLTIDDRGSTAFVNDFRFEDVKRFYMVSNHRAGFVRAWHAHRKEAKYITVVHGVAIVAAVAIDNWKQPSKNAKIHRYVLSAQKPAVLYIPKGYAHGHMTLISKTKLIFFSTSTLEESSKDDIRYDARYWDVWQVVER
jgi:dTDP-4-dehydrorhamnose 3,5-epimerase-like enzyme